MTKMLFVEISPGSEAGPVGARPGSAAAGPARPARGAPGYRPPVTRSRYDVVVVGGGHNGLVAAAYLGRAGRSVLVLERAGARSAAPRSAGRSSTASTSGCPRTPTWSACCPTASWPTSACELRLTDRSVASYTAHDRATAGPAGLLVERDEGPATATSFRQLTGADDEFAGWQRFYGRLATLAEDLAPDADRAAARRRRRSPAGCATPASGTTCASGRSPTSSPTTSPTTSSAGSR